MLKSVQVWTTGFPPLSFLSKLLKNVAGQKNNRYTHSPHFLSQFFFLPGDFAIKE